MGERERENKRMGACTSTVTQHLMISPVIKLRKRVWKFHRDTKSTGFSLRCVCICTIFLSTRLECSMKFNFYLVHTNTHTYILTTKKVKHTTSFGYCYSNIKITTFVIMNVLVVCWSVLNVRRNFSQISLNFAQITSNFSRFSVSW